MRLVARGMQALLTRSPSPLTLGSSTVGQGFRIRYRGGDDRWVDAETGEVRALHRSIAEQLSPHPFALVGCICGLGGGPP